MLSLLNKLALQNELQNAVQKFDTNKLLLDKKVKIQQHKNKKSNIKSLSGAGN